MLFFELYRNSSMPSFRSPQAKARHLVEQFSAIGEQKPKTGATSIHSIATLRIYATSLGLLGCWAQTHGLGDDLRLLSEYDVALWLQERSESVGQKCLDNDRVAVVMALGFDFPRFRSTYVPERFLAEESRAYSDEQIDLVAACQSQRNAFSTYLASAAGLRAHELLTLRHPDELPATEGRDWSDDRFLGLPGMRYTVVGKGGLAREVVIPNELAVALEGLRRATPRTVRDRDINYLTIYDVAGGNAWSKSFSDASQRGLGYSLGGHGLRHGYAQRRLSQLQARGLIYAEAKLVLSQELGHFRADVTEEYLR